MANCYKCKNECTIKEEKGNLFGYPCDFCRNIICSNCAGTSASEVRVLALKTRSLFHLCLDCRENIFKNILELNQKVCSLEEELKKVKCNNDPDSMENRIKSLEENVKEIKHAKQEDKLVDLRKKIKNIEETVAKSNSRNVEASQCGNLEGTLTKVLKETLKNHAKEVSEQIKILSSCVKDENAKVIRMIAEGKKDVDNRQNNVEPSVINPQAVSYAMMETATRDTLNKYINIDKDVEIDCVPGKEQIGSELFKERNASSGVVKGTNKNTSIIAAAEDCKIFYVSNLSMQSSAEKLKAYLLEKKIPIVNCEQMTSNRRGAGVTGLSYKVAIKSDLEKEILNPNLWPENVTIRPFVVLYNRQMRGAMGDNFNENFRHWRPRP